MNCKRQSQHGKYICGLPTVKTCYVFAVVNAVFVILTVLGVLGRLGSLAYYLVVTYEVGWTSELLTKTVIIGVVYLTSAVATIFAIMLLVGIRKKIPMLVMAYLFYGIVVEILLILSTLVFIAINSHNIFLGGGFLIYAAIALCICIVYGLVLYLVINTYLLLRNGPSIRANRTDVQALFMLGADGELQVLPLMQ